MNILKFLESFTDDALMNSTGDRRSSFTQFKKLGANMALAAVPFGLASTFSTKANAASAAFMAETPIQALQLALTLEYLEAEYYETALATSGLIPQADRIIFEQIKKHEVAHVAFLRNALGADVIAEPTFDFTGGSGSGNGPFNPFGDYQQFLAVAQAFEDTGVRAYKGQAGNLMSQPEVLQYALQVHSVEARHASQVRRLRGLKGWIPGNDAGGHPPQADAVYAGEETTIQAGFNTGTVMNFGALSGSEAFDEPITGETANTIAGLFIAS